MYLELQSVSDVEKLRYTELISILEETNRCPGGLSTIRNIARNTFLGPTSRVLEVGSNTGFTSLELARTVGCSAVGIDISASAVAVARRILASDTPRIQALVSFELASAYDLPFEDGAFDVVVAGGSFSFMENRGRAVDEVVRVLRPWGYFSATNLCCFSRSDPEVLRKVSKIIGVTVRDLGPGDWADVYDGNLALQRCETTVNRLRPRSRSEIERYVNYFARKPHIAALPAAVREALVERWRDILLCFNRNHENLGFISLLYRKVALPQEPELFIVDATELLRRADFA